MASHAPQPVLFVLNNGAVAKTGYSTRIGRGQVALVNKSDANTALGLPVKFSALPTTKNTKFEFRYGAPNLEVTRSQSNKSWTSVPFKLSEVVDVFVNAPLLGESVDDMIIGYDGVNVSSAIVLQAGDNEVIDLTLSGEPIGMLGYTDAKVSIKIPLIVPREGNFTMQEVIHNAVKVLKEVKLLGGVPITDFVDIMVVDSTNTALTGTNMQFYHLNVPDEGRDSDLGLVQAQYPTYSVKRTNFLNGETTYTIIGATGLTIPAFVRTSINVADANCDGIPETTEAKTTIAWVAGETCTAKEVTYNLQLADKCGEDRLEEIQLAYPDLTITVAQTPTAGGCQTVYSTTVLSNLVCEECDPIFQDIFSAEAPHSFEMIDWVEVKEGDWNADALMGIRVRGKKQIMAGSEGFRRDTPTIYTSTRISLSNEAPGEVSQSYNKGTNGRFAVKLLSIATEPGGQGFTLRDMEARTKVYFTQDYPACGNYDSYVSGGESLLKDFKQYITYTVRVKRSHPSQSFSGDVTVNYDYIFAVELGRQGDIETLVNHIATGAGLGTVSAY